MYLLMYTYIYIYVCTCICVCMYVCVYVNECKYQRADEYPGNVGGESLHFRGQGRYKSAMTVLEAWVASPNGLWDILTWFLLGPVSACAQQVPSA